MKRDVMAKLLAWKTSRARKPLLVTGVRQCGKTYVLKEFGETCFDNLVYLNFESSEHLAGIFEYDYDVNRILREIEIHEGVSIEVGKTLLFFDEIQECPRAISSLKYFCENMRDLHLVCAGSLLGVAVKRQAVSFPVGKVNRIQMHPLSFGEFVGAVDGAGFLELMKTWPFDRPLSSSHRATMERRLREYYAVGGMPEAVQEWVDTHDLAAVGEIQDELLSGYADDFSKHAPLSQVEKIRWVWDSVPKQLAKENNKFVFSHVKAGKRAAELEDALQWLCDAGLATKLELVENACPPLAQSANATYFKVYLPDVGLLCRKAGVSQRALLEGAVASPGFRGALAENYVLNELIAQEMSCWFWRSGNTAEVDLLTEEDGKVIPVEVKSADNAQAKSYRQFCKRFHPERGFKVSLKNIAVNDCEGTSTVNLPLYLVFSLRRWLGVV